MFLYIVYFENLGFIKFIYNTSCWFISINTVRLWPLTIKFVAIPLCIKGSNSVKLVSVSLQRGICSKRKVAPRDNKLYILEGVSEEAGGGKCFRFTTDLFSGGVWCIVKRTRNQKSCLHCMKQQNVYQVFAVPLNLCYNNYFFHHENMPI